MTNITKPIKEDAPTVSAGGSGLIQGVGPIAFAEKPLGDEKKKKKPMKRLREFIKWSKKTK